MREDAPQNVDQLRGASALAHYNILDTPKEKDFDDIVTLAAEICGTPVSLISLIDKDRQWFKAEHGAGIRETPLDQSMCHILMHQAGVSVVHDASKDNRFDDNSLVHGDFNLRFYAGAPLVTPDGTPLGMLCVLDTQPRELTEQQKRMLDLLARQVMSLMETRRSLNEQRLIAEDLAKTRNRLDLIVDSARDFAIISTKPNGQIESWNSGAMELFGYAPEEMIGQSIARIFTTEDQANGIYERELETAAATGKAIDERWHQHKDGHKFFASGLMQSMIGDNDEIVGFVKVCRDMTARKEMNDALIAARNFAESANVAKSEFLANMSHEIRTPMNAIMGLASILSMTSPLTAKQRQFVDTLKAASESLLVLLNDVLDISKIEAQSIEFEHVPFFISDIVNDVISMMDVRTAEKGLTFTIDDTAIAERRFVGDPSRLRQVITNLCSNAIKFTSRGGVHVAISSEPSDDGNLDMVSIAVKDTGIGIDQAKVGVIFEKFTQADSSINRKYGGTGLGLSISKAIIEAMGGTITVKSIAGEGSTFTILVPLLLAEDQEARATHIMTPRIVNTSANSRVLLVEDYIPNVIVAGAFLQDFGYEYDVANNGTEAVKKAMEGGYHAVLMDVQMQGMNGLEATHLIRAYERETGAARVTIIGMTAHALVGDRERCMVAGMDDYIAKPFNPDELQAKLGNARKKAA